mgnify:CR=1 FL=1
MLQDARCKIWRASAYSVEAKKALSCCALEEARDFVVRPLLRFLMDCIGSRHDGPHFEYAAGKLPLRFWVPEAATRQ